MAKLNSKRFHEVARVNFTTPTGITGILVMRSDRKVLRRLTGDTSTGYSIVTTVPADGFADGRFLAAICVRQGWTITKKEG